MKDDFAKSSLESRIIDLETQLQEAFSLIQTIQQELYEASRWKNAPNQKCLTKEEVAEWIGCKPETIKDYEKKGWLIPAYPNAKRRFSKKDVERLMRGYMPTRRLKRGEK